MPLPRDHITEALDSGRIDLAFGFLPMVKDTQRAQLLKDRYIVLVRKGHPFTRKRRSGKALLEDLKRAGVRGGAHARGHPAHRAADAPGGPAAPDHGTLHGASRDCPGDRPRRGDAAQHRPGLSDAGGYTIVEPPLPLRDFAVSLHWSKRFEADPGNRWLRQAILEIFKS